VWFFTSNVIGDQTAAQLSVWDQARMSRTSPSVIRGPVGRRTEPANWTKITRGTTFSCVLVLGYLHITIDRPVAARKEEGHFLGLMGPLLAPTDVD
jgi:hypothetical protein